MTNTYIGKAISEIAAQNFISRASMPDLKKNDVNHEPSNCSAPRIKMSQ